MLYEVIAQVSNNDMSMFRRVGVGNRCFCYQHYEHEQYVLKSSSLDGRVSEDYILAKFCHLDIIPKLYWSTGKKSIVEYVDGKNLNDIKNVRIEHVDKLLNNVFELLDNGIILDITSSNLLYSDSVGFKMIDCSSYNKVNLANLDWQLSVLEEELFKKLLKYIPKSHIDNFISNRYGIGFTLKDLGDLGKLLI